MGTKFKALYLLAFSALVCASGCNMMLEEEPAPNSADLTSALFGGRSPDGDPVTPEVIPTPSPTPEGDGRSELDGAECPWGADQTAEAKAIQQSEFKIDYDCDLVLYNEDLFGSVKPGWPTFDEVKKNFLATQVALAGDPTFLKQASKLGLSNVTFNIKTDGTALDFAGRTLFFSGYGNDNLAPKLAYLKTVFEFDETHLDGLPVISAMGGADISGSDVELEGTLSTLTAFAQTYATYRDQFLAARDSIREVKVDEKEVELPIFRNGTLEMAQTTQKPWAVADALSLAKAYLLLPAAFRERLTIDFTLPDAPHPEQTRPEQSTAKAVESFAKLLPKVESKAPNLQHLTIDTCTDPNTCGSVSADLKTLDLGMFLNASVISDSQLAAEVTRLLGL